MRYLPKILAGIAFSLVVVAGITSPIFSHEAHANNGIYTSAIPSSGTLTPGQQLIVDMTVTLDANDTNPLTGECVVNGVDVANTFNNMTSGTNGHVQFTYTVGASNTDRAAGQVPINCNLHQTGSVNVTAFDDNNTVAINASGSGTGTTTDGGTGTTTDNGGGNTGGGSSPVAPVLSGASISPSSGTLITGNQATVTFTESHGQKDLAVTGSCLINATDVASSFQNMNDGTYRVTYAVSSGDGERPAGHIPVSCTLGNSAGNMAAHSWTDGNTTEIDTNADGHIDNGTSTLGFTVSAAPSTGTLHTGDSVVISMQDPLPSGDVVIASQGCRVNDVDVSGSYGYHDNGLYKVTYTVGAGNANRSAGQIPFDCTLQNQTGSVHLTYFTDSNTLAVDTTGTGGGNGTTTGTTTDNGGGNTGGSTASTTNEYPLTFVVSATPNFGMRSTGQMVEVHFVETHSNRKIVLNGSCRVNGVEVNGTFQDQTDGMYRVDYVVGANDAERAAGTLPLSCPVRDWHTGSTTVITAFTDGNGIAIDPNGDGMIATSTGSTTAPYIQSVNASPSSGMLSTGNSLNVTITEGTGNATFGIGTCTINNKDVSMTFLNQGNGAYRVTYTAASGDTERSAGQVPIDCMLTSSGSNLHVISFTDNNTVSIGTTTNNGGNGGNNGTSTGGTIGGDVTGGSASTTGALHVDSVHQVRGTATAGGGYDQGWEWVFRVTVPSNEPDLAMKFADWTHSDTTSHIGTANNMRISSAQAASTSAITITGADTYSSPNLHITGDLDPNAPGMQVDVVVEMQVPSSTLNGSYTTNYSVRSL